MEKMYSALRLAAVFFMVQWLVLSNSWASEGPLLIVTWQYTFALPRDQATKQDASIQQAAAKNKAAVSYAFQEKSEKNAIRVVLDGSNTTVAQLNDIVSGKNVGLKRLIDQPTKVSIKGYVAKQSPVSLVLSSNITTGTQWKLDAASLAFVDGNPTGAYEQTSPLLGGEGRQTFVLNPLVSGEVSIQLSYGKHWEAATDDSSALHIQVNGALPEFLDLSGPAATSLLTSKIDQETQTSSIQDTGSLAPLVGLPSAFDLRTSGGLTSVKDQGQCGSCWAFATVGVLEGLVKKNTGETVDLSEQFLVSCNRNNWSCNGGWWAHDYHKASGTLGSLQSVAGAVLEADMPYANSNGTCTAIPNHPKSLSSWAYVGPTNGVADTDAIKNAIFSYGPVSVAVCAGQAFGNYTSGVFNTEESSSVCSGGINHAVVLVGWDDNTRTWLLRNSWGTGWGESGYMRIAWGTSKIGYGATYASYGNTCAFDISPTGANPTAAGGSGSISVTSASGCAWTASSNVSWISIGSGSGSGSGTVGYVVSPNSGSARTGTITAAGKTFTVTQQGSASCTYTISPTAILSSALGETGNINVSTQNGCAWSTSNALGWVRIVSGSSGTGSGTVVYSVSPNFTSSRTGALTIAGKTVAVSQQAATQCTYSLNSLSNSFGSSGGAGTVNVLTQSSCAWTATSGVSWLTLGSGSSGTGSGTVSYSVSANTSTTSRSGTLSIGGQIFNVNQLGASQGADLQLSNGVALTGQSLASSVSQGAWKYYSFEVPVGATNLVIDLYGLSGDLDLFGRQGDKPTADIYNCVSYRNSTYREQCVITSPTPGKWWVGVNNYDIGTLGFSIKASWGASDTQLTSGVATSGSVASSPTVIWKYFYIDVPSGATRLVADLYNLTGDVDAYLKYGSKPDINSIDDCVSNNGGTTPDQCDILSPAAGRWWLAVVNYDATVSYSIKATTSGNSTTTLQNGVPVTGISGTAGSSKLFSVAVPSGARNLVISTSGGAGDVDLYVRLGQVSTTSYDCYSNYSGNSESCTFNAPATGTYYALLYGYSTYSGVAVKASYTTGGAATSGNDTLMNAIGNNTVDGMAGIDTYVSVGSGGNYYLDPISGHWELTDRYGSEGTDTLLNIERLRFSNGVQAIDIGAGQIGGMAYRIYRAAFNRTPDNGGLKYWMNRMDTGYDVVDVAAGFIGSAEFVALYGSHPTDGDFITRVYSNVLGRAPDSAGYNYWIGVLSSGVSRSQVLVGFSESAENIAAVSLSIPNGIWMPD